MNHQNGPSTQKEFTRLKESLDKEPGKQELRLTPRGKKTIKGGVAGLMIVGAGVTGVAINNHAQAVDAEKLHKNVPTISVEASDKVTVHKAKPGDTVGSMTIDYSDINAIGDIDLSRAAANAREMVKDDPRNAKTLEDGVLQVGEPLVIPKEITVIDNKSNTQDNQ